jgi:hypothetical protein
MAKAEKVVRIVGNPLVETIVGTEGTHYLFYFFASSDHVFLLIGK